MGYEMRNENEPMRRALAHLQSKQNRSMELVSNPDFNGRAGSYVPSYYGREWGKTMNNYIQVGELIRRHFVRTNTSTVIFVTPGIEEKRWIELLSHKYHVEKINDGTLKVSLRFRDKYASIYQARWYFVFTIVFLIITILRVSL